MKIRDAAIDFYRAREKQKETKQALGDYRRENGGCKYEDGGDERCPPCYLSGEPIDGNEEFGPWCDNCRTSQPLWEARRKAANKAGAALRTLLMLCRKAV